MPPVVFEDYKVIDVDTHVSEPEDLWTSRVSVKKWGDMVPHVVPYEEAMERAGSRGGGFLPGERVWIVGGEPSWGVALVAYTDSNKVFPASHPLTLEEAFPGAYLPSRGWPTWMKMGSTRRSSTRTSAASARAASSS